MICLNASCCPIYIHKHLQLLKTQRHMRMISFAMYYTCQVYFSLAEMCMAIETYLQKIHSIVNQNFYYKISLDIFQGCFSFHCMHKVWSVLFICVKKCMFVSAIIKCKCINCCKRDAYCKKMASNYILEILKLVVFF